MPGARVCQCDRWRSWTAARCRRDAQGPRL